MCEFDARYVRTRHQCMATFGCLRVFADEVVIEYMCCTPNLWQPVRPGCCARCGVEPRCRALCALVGLCTVIVMSIFRHSLPNMRSIFLLYNW